MGGGTQSFQHTDAPYWIETSSQRLWKNYKVPPTTVSSMRKKSVPTVFMTIQIMYYSWYSFFFWYFLSKINVSSFLLITPVLKVHWKSCLLHRTILDNSLPF